MIQLPVLVIPKLFNDTNDYLLDGYSSFRVCSAEPVMCSISGSSFSRRSSSSVSICTALNLRVLSSFSEGTRSYLLYSLSIFSSKSTRSSGYLISREFLASLSVWFLVSTCPSVKFDLLLETSSQPFSSGSDSLISSETLKMTAKSASQNFPIIFILPST